MKLKTEVLRQTPRNVEGVESEMSEVIVATRHQGATLFPIDKWPVYVHVALPAVQGIHYPTVVETQIGDLYPKVWAELYPTEDDARNKPIRYGER